MLAEADYGITEMAHNAQAGDDQLLVKFYIKAKHDPTASEEAGRPIYKDTEYVSIIQPGNKDNVVERPATDRDKQRFPKHYAAFKNRVSDSDEYLEGTLLDEWPGITRSQVEELKFFNVRTVEQLVNLADSGAQNIMGVHTLKEKAKRFLASKADDAAAAELAARDAKIAEQQKLIDALSARLDALEAEVEEVEE